MNNEWHTENNEDFYCCNEMYKSPLAECKGKPNVVDSIISLLFSIIHIQSGEDDIWKKELDNSEQKYKDERYNKYPYVESIDKKIRWEE